MSCFLPDFVALKRSSYINKDCESKMLTLKEYQTLVEKNLNPADYIFWTNQDAFDYLVESLMFENCRWDGRGHLGAFLINRLKFYKKIWLKGHRKQVPEISIYKKIGNNKDDDFSRHSRICDTIPVREELDELTFSHDHVLSDIQKECLTLFFVEGLNRAKIAERLNMTREAVRQNVQRGLKRLRQYGKKV